MSGLKKTTVKILLAASSACVLFGGTLFVQEKAKADDSAFPANGTLEINDGISLKLNENGGMRFVIKMNETTYNFVKTDDTENAVSLIALIGPSAAFNTYEDYVSRAENFIKIEIDENTLFTVDGFYYANACVINMLPENYEYDYTAAAYVVSGETVLKESVVNENASGSFYAVANQALLTTDSTAEILSLSSYSWLGSEQYPIYVKSLERYNALVEKINDGVDFAGKNVSVAHFDMTGKTELANGKTLPENAVFDNAITELTSADIVYGETPSPVSSAYYGENGVTYTYSQTADGDYAEWKAGETRVGTWYVKATIPAGVDANGVKYEGAEKIAQFVLSQAANEVTFPAEAITLHCKQQLPDFGATAKYGTVVYTYSKDNVTFGSAADFGDLIAGETCYVKASVAATEYYAAAEKVKSFVVEHAFGEATEENGISTKTCACGAKQVNGKLNHDSIDLAVSVTDSEATVTAGTLNLASVYTGNANATLTIGEEKFENVAVANGKISLAGVLSASLYGQQSFTVDIRDGESTYALTVSVLLITKSIANEEDLKNIGTIETALGGKGYYLVTEDITMSEKWSDSAANVIGREHDFVGVIDGKGHKVIGFTIEAVQSCGFINKLGAGGVLKNIAFVDAVFKGRGGFIVTAENKATVKLIENVYIGIKTYDSIEQDSLGLFGSKGANNGYTMKNVIIDYTGSEVNNIANKISTVLFGSFGYYSSFKNVAVIGVLTELESYIGDIRSEQKDKIYISYSDNTNNGVAIPDSGWDESFWTMEEGDLPAFVGILKQKAITLTDVTVDLNVSVADGAATAGNAVTINLGSGIKGTVSNVIVTLGGATYEGFVTNGGLTFNAPATVWGNQTFTVTCTNDTTKYTITISALFVTKYIASEADLQNISVIETALQGNGYYMLTSDIQMTEQWLTYKWHSTAGKDELQTNYTIGYEHAFKGVIDGNGYKIVGLTANTYWANTGFINQFGAGGTVKNIAFIDAVFKQRSGFIMNSAGGVLENVYLGIKTFDNGTQTNHGLFGPAYTDYKFNMKNVIIDYTDAEINNVDKNGTTLFGSFSGGSKFENVVVKGIPIAYKGTDYEGKGLTNSDGSYKMYISYSDGTANGVTLPDSGWDAEYWAMTEGALPTFKTKEN